MSPTTAATRSGTSKATVASREKQPRPTRKRRLNRCAPHPGGNENETCAPSFPHARAAAFGRKHLQAHCSPRTASGASLPLWGFFQRAPKRCSEHLFKSVAHNLSGI